ncbi:ABC transporter substrate-binding protein [Curvivirga aplysinae]|uniref:ABC transporter substrate-binding protein n=1 Tax=Curvivirga aplysinae TaxID=2529852 RepID=UPI0012BB6327|nr:ABC transporter substrate-binding protein [Curvivirga aplysinae]MTI08902.1 ABC transporter substrate-binding protein [Curvivirga aplysinae]
MIYGWQAGGGVLKISLFVALTIMWVLSPLAAHADESIVIKHYQYQERYKFGHQLLLLAISKLDIPFVVQGPTTQDVNEKRGENQILEGRLDIEWMSTTRDREDLLIPIKIPLYRGVLGLRLLLVTPTMHPSISEISTLDDLQSYTGGYSQHWGDLPVFEANNLRVDTSTVYESIFKKLIYGRFDYFHRGVQEIWDEQKRYNKQLIVADNIMLFYPHPVYFFVGKHRPELAKNLRRGLDIAMEDGSYKKLFFEYFEHYIKLGNLENRKLIVLNNPVVPQDTPALDTSWWMPMKYQNR